MSDADIKIYSLNQVCDIEERAFHKGRAAAFAEVEEAMYHQCFECDNDEDMQKWDSGNWLRYKLFENVMEQLRRSEE